MGTTQDDAFGPKDLEAMSQAYEDVCTALHINGDAAAREAIAVRVIELARRGERCPTVMRDQVISEARRPVSPAGRSRPTRATRSRLWPAISRQVTPPHGAGIGKSATDMRFFPQSV